MWSLGLLAVSFAAYLHVALSATNLAGYEPYIKPLTMHTSLMSCNTTERQLSMCIMSNAYYWNKTIYFVATDPRDVHLSIPRFSLPLEKPMPDIVKVVTRDQLQALLSAPIEGNVRNTKLLQYNQGIMYHRLFVNNYYHTFWEGVANVHTVACKMFGKCSYNPSEKELQLFFIDEYSANLSLPHAQLFKCVTSLDYEQMAAPHLPLPARILQLTLGLGTEGFGQGAVMGRRRAPGPSVRNALVTRMRTCMNMPPVPPDILDLEKPLVTIVQRPRGHTGRALSNVEEVADWVRELMPGFEVQIVHMEGMSLQEQAEIWGKSAVVISNHGAQLSNVLYMPNNSFVIEVEQYKMRYWLYRNHAMRPLAPFLTLGHEYISPQNISSINVTRLDALMQHAKFANLTAEQQQSWLQEPDCWRYTWVTPQLLGICVSQWVKFHTDVIVDRSLLEPAVLTALKWVNDHRLNPASA